MLVIWNSIKTFALPVMVPSHADVTVTDDVEVIGKMLDDGAFMEAIVEDSKLCVFSFLSDANKGFFWG